MTNTPNKSKLKSITKKLLITFLAFTLLIIAPSKTAEAKDTEMSKFVNKSAMKIISSLKLKKAKDNDEIPYYTYSMNGKRNDPVSLTVIKKYENRKNCWTIHLSKKDCGITACGLKPKMGRKKAHNILLKKGWKCEKGFKWTDSYVNYVNSKGYLMTIDYRSSKKNAKLYSVNYSPETPDAYK